MDDITHLDSTTKYVLTDTGKPSKDFFNWIKKLNGWISDATSNINNLNSEWASLNSAWSSYTPTVTAQTGTITSYTSAGRFKQIGKTVDIQIQITITNAGTAGVFLIATLPVPAYPVVQMIGGRESVSGNALSGVIQGSTVAILYYNNTFAGATGSQPVVGGVYEAA